MTVAFEQGRIPPIEIRHRLRIAREFAGLDQEQLADLVGVSRGTIGNAETGRAHPRKILVNAWALACGVPSSWLQTGEVDEGPDGPNSGLRIIRPECLPSQVSADDDAMMTLPLWPHTADRAA